MNTSSWNIDRFFNHTNVNDDDIISKIIDITKLRSLYNYIKTLFPEFGYKVSNPSKLYFFDA